MQSEKDVKADIRSFLNGLVGWHFAPMMNGYGKTGVPDDVGHWCGLFIAIEAKAPHRMREPNGGCSARQFRAINEINATGGIAFVAYDVEQVKRIYRKIYLAMEKRQWTLNICSSLDGVRRLLSDSELELPWAASLISQLSLPT